MRAVEFDVRGKIASSRRDRDDDDQCGRTLVHVVVGDDDSGASARLLSADRLSEIKQPDLSVASDQRVPSARVVDSPARSDSIALQASSSLRNWRNRSLNAAKNLRRSRASRASSRIDVIVRESASASLANRSRVSSLTRMVVLTIRVYNQVDKTIYIITGRSAGGRGMTRLAG